MAVASHQRKHTRVANSVEDGDRKEREDTYEAGEGEAARGLRRRAKGKFSCREQRADERRTLQRQWQLDELLLVSTSGGSVLRQAEPSAGLLGARRPSIAGGRLLDGRGRDLLHGKDALEVEERRHRRRRPRVLERASDGFVLGARRRHALACSPSSARRPITQYRMDTPFQ